MKTTWSVEVWKMDGRGRSKKKRKKNKKGGKSEDEDMGLVQILWAEGGKHYSGRFDTAPAQTS